MIQWTAADAQYIRNIFSQPSGQKFLKCIQACIPKVRATKLEQVQIEALLKQGAENLYEAMLSLAEHVEPELEEDQWVDLNKEGD